MLPSGNTTLKTQHKNYKTKEQVGATESMATALQNMVKKTTPVRHTNQVSLSLWLHEYIACLPSQVEQLDKRQHSLPGSSFACLKMVFSKVVVIPHMDSEGGLYVYTPRALC